LRLASAIVDDGWTYARAAERFQCSTATPKKWADRYRDGGEAAMADRSSRPHRSPRRDAQRRERRIIKVLRMDNGPELVFQALQRFCDNKVGLSYIPPGAPWDGAYIESFNNRLRKGCLNRNHWNTLFEARVVIGDFKHDHNHRHRIRPWATRRRPSTLRPAGTPTLRWPARSTESETKQPDSNSGWTQ